MSGVVGIVLVLSLAMRAVGQHSHVEAFDEPAVSWRIQYPEQVAQSATRVRQHRREPHRVGDGRFEVLRVQTAGRNQRLQLTHAVPPARPFDELTLKLRVRSTQGGLQLGARLVFADHTDPRTGKPLTAIIRGQTYRQRGEWAELVCQFDRTARQNALSELRGKTSLDLVRAGHTYVDQAVLLCDFNPGSAVVAIDDLQFGPIVVPARTIVEQGNAPPTKRSADDLQTPQVRLRLGQLRVQNKPFFPRMAAWHRGSGESIQTLKYSGVNTVWIRDAFDTDAIRSLSDAGMLVIAEPPRASPNTDVRTVSTNSPPAVSLPPGPAMWYLGTRIPSTKHAQLRDWSAELKRTDPLRRPIMADVTGGERVYSRHLNLLGVSRPVLGTSLTLRDYRDSLIHARANAQPGSFTWNWVQVEQPSAFTATGGVRPEYVVEPEQIRLQTWAAIASGSKGIGYWKTSSLDGSRSGDRERRLMLHQLNLEIGLVEDWLATSELRSRIRCEAGVAMEPSGRRLQVGVSSRGRSTNIEAAVLSCAQGKLVVPIWFSATAQYSPSEMVADNISFLVHVAEAERDAYLVTTTGIRRLTTGVEAGGLRVRISTTDRQVLFDQTAMILIAPKAEAVREIRSRISAIAADSAKTMIDLAEAKRDRVQAVENRFVAPDSRTQQTLDNVNAAITAARTAVTNENFDLARRDAQKAMGLLRRLQHVRWRAGSRMLGANVSSPHGACYSDLPNQIRLAEHLQSVQPVRTASLMPIMSGSETSSLQAANWKHSASNTASIQSRAKFVKGTTRYELDMLARPANPKSIPDFVSVPPVRVTAAPLQLEPGELVRVRGKVRLEQPVIGNVNGAMVFDNLMGPSNAVRWRKPTNGWQEFELIRETDKASQFYLTFVLTGLGQARIADIEVAVYPGRQTLPRILPAGG